MLTNITHSSLVMLTNITHPNLVLLTNITHSSLVVLTNRSLLSGPNCPNTSLTCSSPCASYWRCWARWSNTSQLSGANYSNTSITYFSRRAVKNGSLYLQLHIRSFLLLFFNINFFFFFFCSYSPAWKISGLKDAWRCLQTVSFFGPITSTFNVTHFNEDLFACQCDKEDKKA